MAKPSAELQQWSDLVRSMPEDDLAPPTVPLHELFGEAVDVAKFFEKYWKTERDDSGDVARIGLESVAPKAKQKPSRGRRLSPKTGQEILSLQRAAQEAHALYLLTSSPSEDSDPTRRGQLLLGELTAALEWYCNDGVADKRDEALARIDAAHANDPDTADALAGALIDYAALAQQHRGDLDGLGGFDAAYIDAARKVAEELRRRPARAAVVSQAMREARILRNKLITLLIERMSAVRAAARFVYRDRPDLVREVTSAYERERRAAPRRNKRPAEEQPASSVS
jgi:hypothetical protein